MVRRLPAAKLEVHDPVHAYLPHVLQALGADVLSQLHAEARGHVGLGVIEPSRPGRRAAKATPRQSSSRRPPPPPPAGGRHSTTHDHAVFSVNKQKVMTFASKCCCLSVVILGSKEVDIS